MHSKLFLGFLGFLLTGQAIAMEPESIRVSLYRKGETIAGEEFIAANEGVVDYIATLRRPTEGLRPIRYNCTVKGTAIRPGVQNIGSIPSPQPWVQIVTIYEMRDCIEIP